jgi:uncharacterized protein YbjT (DUF2867 family)
MLRILITDAVGLVGAYIIKALLSSSEFQSTQYSIIAGYHSETELNTARPSVISNDSIHPVLVDWADEKTYYSAVS